MGYRSEVYFAVYAHNKEDFVAAFTRWRLDNGVDFTEWDIGTRREMVDNEAMFGFLFYDPETKWYSTYEDVQEVEDTLPRLPDYGFLVEFVRVGEESGDIDIRNGSPEGTSVEGVFWVSANIHEYEEITYDAVDHEPGDKSWIASYVENQSTIGDQRSAIQLALTAESEKHAV